VVHERLKSDNVRKCDVFSVCMVILLSVRLCLERSFCHPNPCLNGGTCSQSDESYTCVCEDGYKGKNCEGQ